MNCLSYLLEQKSNFTILYDGNHCYSKDFDFDFSLRGDESKYLPLEDCHSLETVIKIFELNKNHKEKIRKYYEVRKVK